MQRDYRYAYGFGVGCIVDFNISIYFIIKEEIKIRNIFGLIYNLDDAIILFYRKMSLEENMYETSISTSIFHCFLSVKIGSWFSYKGQYYLGF